MGKIEREGLLKGDQGYNSAIGDNLKSAKACYPCLPLNPFITVLTSLDVTLRDKRGNNLMRTAISTTTKYALILPHCMNTCNSSFGDMIGHGLDMILI